MKVSEITVVDVAQYLHYDEEQISNLTAAESKELDEFKKIAVAFVCSYTGLKEAELDAHEDISIVVLVLCQDMHDNRCLYVDKGNISFMVKTILDMHSVNLI